jgi:threonine synthase
VGNAGNISAYWMGYKEYDKGRPRLLGAQASGAAPIVRGQLVEHPETVATAIRIGNPARWREALQALDESDGLITAVGDPQILEHWSLLAEKEGIFVEPASAAGLAALSQQVAAGKLDPAGKTVVVVLTGHGLKDPGTAVEQAETPISIPAEIAALEAYLAQ